jgi:hypothetical protein
MRYLLAILLLLCCTGLWAQPTNDNCNNATLIALPVISACPDAGTVEMSLNATNTLASPSEPAIQVTSDFGTGNTLDSPLADVWFSITPTSNRLILFVHGELQNPSIVLFQNGECDNKLPVNFATSTNNSGNVELFAEVIPGTTYLLMVAGGNANDQGDFSLRVVAYNDCYTCSRRQGQLNADPAPVNGTYQAGQEVDFCYTIDLWDPGFSLEWLHALTLELGEGWDLSDFSYTVPQSCTPGSWEWYDSWEGCNTGLDFGPGFAFDAQMGLLCPGAAPNDGLPGNNFGDGPCGSIEASPLPLEFCWTLKVKDSFTTATEKNLNIKVNLLGDGYSGSWMSNSCTDNSSSIFLATSVPAMALLPSFEIIDPSCESSCTGKISIDGQGNSSWNYTLFDELGNVVYSTPAFTGSDTLTNLCPGQYQFELTEINGTANQQMTINIPTLDLPTVQAGFLPACDEGEQFQLVAGLSSPVPNTTYSWMGPDNFTANIASPMANIHGNYQLDVSVEGCNLSTVMIETAPLRKPIDCEVSTDAVIFSWEALPQDTAYNILVLSGQDDISWLDNTTVKIDNLSPEEEVIIELTALGDGFCTESIQEGNCQTLACSPPVISEDFIICSGDDAELLVDDNNLESISWSPTNFLSCTDCPNPVATPVNTITYEVTTTTTQGCTHTQAVTVFVDQLSEEILPDEPVMYCPGIPFDFCLPEENRYLWISPIGFIQTGYCLIYPYTNQSIAGEYLVRIRLPDGCQFSETLTLSVDPSCISGLVVDNTEELDLEYRSDPSNVEPVKEDIQLFPNPSSGTVIVNCTSPSTKMIRVYGLTGQEVYQTVISDLSNTLTLDMLVAGTYLIQIRSDTQSWQEKLIITR